MKFLITAADLQNNPRLRKGYHVGKTCESTSFDPPLVLKPPVQLRLEVVKVELTPKEGYVEPTLEETVEEVEVKKEPVVEPKKEEPKVEKTVIEKLSETQVQVPVVKVQTPKVKEPVKKKTVKKSKVKKK